MGYGSALRNTLSLLVVPSGAKLSLRLTACELLSTEAQQRFLMAHAATILFLSEQIQQNDSLIFSARYVEIVLMS